MTSLEAIEAVRQCEKVYVHVVLTKDGDLCIPLSKREAIKLIRDAKEHGYGELIGRVEREGKDFYIG